MISHAQEGDLVGVIIHFSPGVLSLCEPWSLSTNKSENLVSRDGNNAPAH